MSFLKKAFCDYSCASGQLINSEKYGIFFSSNATHEDAVWVENFLGVKVFDGTIRYLGLPASAIFGRSKSQALISIVQKAIGKLEGWKNRSLKRVKKY